MLESIASDFAQMESQARSDETSQQDSHDTWLTATSANIAELKTDTQMKKARKETQSAKLEAKKLEAKQLEAKHAAEAQRQKDAVKAQVEDLRTRFEALLADPREAALAARVNALRGGDGAADGAGGTVELEASGQVWQAVPETSNSTDLRQNKDLLSFQEPRSHTRIGQ